MVLYEFRSMPPGPRLTSLPVVGNAFSLDFKAEKLTDAFQRSVNNTQYNSGYDRIFRSFEWFLLSEPWILGYNHKTDASNLV